MAEDWTTAGTITTELNRLSGQHAEKQKRTILALVDARLAGRSEETVWTTPGTCNRSTYHTKWKKDPVFAGVLDACTKAAIAHRDGAAARALAQAAERLALLAPPAVGRLAGLLNSDDEAIILRASVAILDRAGVETGAKSQSTATVQIADWRADAERRRQQAAETIDAYDDDADPYDADPDDTAENTSRDSLPDAGSDDLLD